MGNVWKDYENSVDESQLQKDIAEARKGGNFEDLPAGRYEVKFTTIEAGLTKTDKRPMLKIAAKVLSGKYKNRLMFMNRVLKGTRNDANMIASAEGWLAGLEAEDENGDLIVPYFKSYPQFADQIMDIAEAVDEMEMEYEVEYDSGAFNSIHIVKVLED